ncbi:MAG: PspC domain-containing protein [Candidatus Aquicultor sp.]
MSENNPQEENSQKDKEEAMQQNTASERPEAAAKAVPVETKAGEAKKLCRSRTNKVLGGVAGGIGEYLAVDPILIRLAFVLLAFFGGAGILAYIIAWIIIPPCEPGSEGSATGPRPSRASSNEVGLILGLILVGLGIWFLLQNLNLIPGPFYALFRFISSAFWPAMLILLGVLIILATSRSRGMHISAGGRPLHRSRTNRMIAGVAGGLGEYFDIDPILIRLVWAVLIFTPLAPAAIIAYIIMAIVVPEAPEHVAG